LVKRGEVEVELGDYDEAVRDFTNAKKLTSEFLVEQKLVSA